MDLFTRINELVRAGFSGIWVETVECEDAIREIARGAAEKTPPWGFDVWDIDKQLYSRVVAAPGPLQAIRAMDLPKTHEIQVLVLKNFHRFLGNPEVLQSLANHVHEGKSNGQFVIIVAPTVALQPEIEKLFTIVHHDLPNETQLRAMCVDLCESNSDFTAPTPEQLTNAIDAARGLTRQEAENAFALTLAKNLQLVPNTIWDIKAQTLEKSGNMALYRGDANFANLGGLDNLKQFCIRAMRKQGEAHIDKRPKGVLLLSPPGCGKSQFAKALGNEVGRPTVMLDFGSLMGKFVGESEGNMRRALKQVDAMAPCVLFVDEIEKALAGVGNSGQTDSGVSARLFGTLLTWLNDHESDVFFIGTCNDATQLPAPFTRAERFDGIFFVDLPAAEQRRHIWDIYIRHFNLDAAQPKPDDENWTGAEIKSCCRLAALLDVTLLEAAQNVVPVSVTSAEQIENLRQWAEGRCLSADNPGLYSRVGRRAVVGAARGRRVSASVSEN
jgi:hypothetical protein